MARRDDMTISPRLRRQEEKAPRERSREERRTTKAKRKQRSLQRKIRRASRLRRLRRRGRVRGSKRVALSNAAEVRLVKRAGKRVAMAAARGGTGGPAGVAVAVAVALAAEAVILAGQTARRMGGSSGRLIARQDAQTMYGDLRHSAAAAVATRGMIEGQGTLLRIIGSEGRVNDQIAKLGADLHRMELRRIQGADLIALDPHFDSPESMIDLLIAKAREADLPGLATKAMGLIREMTGRGAITSGR